MSTPRLAAIDVGSNTLHLIVVECERGNRLKHILDKSRLMELGLLEAQKGTLPDYAQGSIRRTLESLVSQARDEGASAVLIGATAALRSDPRSKEIIARLTRAVGVPVRIISKRREIELGFLAVRHALRSTGRQMFVDCGGASTEITVCQGRRPLQTISLPVGAAGLSVLLEGDPPSLLSFARLMVPIQNALRKAPVVQPVRSAIFSGGTAHHICDVAGESRRLVTRAALERALRHLLKKPARKIAKKYCIDAQRVPLLISGAVILAAILEHYGLDRTAVTADTIREGMIRAYLSHPGAWWKNSPSAQIKLRGFAAAAPR
jgi:exopolyphosphatase/guanosine-5'-triphosphate,3'-diphosphate pyrophosphatase